MMDDSSQRESRARQLASLSVRLALAASFLSAVADRFGLWGGSGTGEVAWGNFVNFVNYTEVLLWFLPQLVVTMLAWAVTVLEVLLAVALICGIRTRLVAATSSILLLTFATCMTFATGPEGPLTYSVWSASAAAFLLATQLSFDT